MGSLGEYSSRRMGQRYGRGGETSGGNVRIVYVRVRMRARAWVCVRVRVYVRVCSHFLDVIICPERLNELMGADCGFFGRVQFKEDGSKVWRGRRNGWVECVYCLCVCVCACACACMCVRECVHMCMRV